VPNDKNDDPLFDRKTAAKYIGLTNPNTLNVWDCTGRHDLEPIKIGRAVRYRRSSLDKYLASRLVKNLKRR
jgi:predicted DNA-binding transcriptional regulator AlpA